MIGGLCLRDSGGGVCVRHATETSTTTAKAEAPARPAAGSLEFSPYRGVI